MYVCLDVALERKLLDRISSKFATKNRYVTIDKLLDNLQQTKIRRVSENIDRWGVRPQAEQRAREIEAEGRAEDGYPCVMF